MKVYIVSWAESWDAPKIDSVYSSLDAANDRRGVLQSTYGDAAYDYFVDEYEVKD